MMPLSPPRHHVVFSRVLCTFVIGIFFCIIVDSYVCDNKENEGRELISCAHKRL